MQAWMRNLGTCRLDAKGATRVRTHEGLSTEARHRDGVVRSSSDAAVMAAERRRGLIRTFLSSLPSQATIVSTSVHRGHVYTS